MLLGHRRRLLFDTVATQIVGPSVEQGHLVTVFAYLENGTMAMPYLSAGGSIQEHPNYRGLTDAQLRAKVAEMVRGSGGRIGSILIGPPPAASFPTAPWAAWRMFHYDDTIRQTVAVALKKEWIAYQLLALHERKRQLK